MSRASRIIRGTLYKYRRPGSITKFSITRPQNLGFLISLHFSRAPVNLLLPTNLPSNFFLSSPSPLSRTAYKICTHSEPRGRASTSRNWIWPKNGHRLFPSSPFSSLGHVILFHGDGAPLSTRFFAEFQLPPSP